MSLFFYLSLKLKNIILPDELIFVKQNGTLPPSPSGLWRTGKGSATFLNGHTGACRSLLGF